MQHWKISRKWWPLIVAGVIVIIVAVFILRSHRKSNSHFLETKVVRGDLSLTILATGTVQPENRLEIKPPIAGRVEEVLIQEGQQVKKGQILAWMSSAERAAVIDTARSQGAAELKRWEGLYRPTPVLAPMAGTIIHRSVEPGQTFSSTESILVMSDRLTVKAQVDETDIAQIKLHQAAEIILDAYPNEKIPAEVDQIAFDSTLVNNVTTYIVDVLPKQMPDFMRSGMTANARFVTESKDKILLIPNSAIQFEGAETFVLAKNLQGKREKRHIELGISDGKETEVVAGLQENDIVFIPQVSSANRNSKGSNPLSPFGGTRSHGH